MFALNDKSEFWQKVHYELNEAAFKSDSNIEINLPIAVCSLE